MKKFCALFILLSCVVYQHQAVAFVPPQKATSSSVALHSEASTENELKDFRGAAAGIFGNVRIPAALFAGAAAGGAFAMPLAASEGVKVGMVKRIYSLLMLSTLSSQVLAVVVSTLSVGSLSTQPEMKAASLEEFLQDYYELEWVTTRLHFFSGVLFFVSAVGLRAWITISCPIFAKGSVGVILSALLLCLSFLQKMEGGHYLLDGYLKLPLRYVALLWQRAKKSGMFAASLITAVITAMYLMMCVPHTLSYLMAGH